MRRVARWVDACEVVNERGLFSAQGMTQLINIQGDRSVVCFHACCKVNATRIPRECHHQQLHVSPTAHQSHVQSPHVIDRSQTDPSFGGGGAACAGSAAGRAGSAGWPACTPASRSTAFIARKTTGNDRAPVADRVCTGERGSIAGRQTTSAAKQEIVT